MLSRRATSFLYTYITTVVVIVKRFGLPITAFVVISKGGYWVTGESAELMTLAQAAKLLGMDRSAAYRAFPVEVRRRIGTVWFVSQSDVDAYAAEQRRGWPIGRSRKTTDADPDE